MKKKILKTLMFVLAILTITTSVFASDGLFQISAEEDVYKLSENSEIVLPFMNIFSKSAVYDKDVNHSGITFASNTMDVEKKLKGIHLMISSDMLNIKGEVEHLINYSKNVVITGKVSKDSLIMGRNVQIMDTAEISEDVIIIADNLEIMGNVKGNVIAIVSNEINIKGNIEKDLRVIAGKLTLEKDSVKGNLYVKTDMDLTSIKEMYPNATFEKLTKQTKQNTGKKVLNIITKGIITVVIYTLIAYLMFKKDNNIIKRATEKFKIHTIYGVIMGLVAFMLVIILPIILVMLAVAGLGVIAWPVLIAYLAIILFSISVSTFVVGAAIFSSVEDKIKFNKIFAIAGIYIALFAICNIPYIAYYAYVAINLISLSIILTGLTRKAKDKVEDKK